ncbi:MAG: sigma 54-interacting transcriptional regulator [Myxococcales bacterium]|nr:sigma 54-interacting transcriptional regulator [Myxococcales bacterium]
MSSDPPELWLTQPPSTTPVRVPLRRALTTIGAAPGADVKLATVPPHWLVAQADAEGVTVVVMASGARHRLALNQATVIDGVRLLLTPPGGDDAPIPVGQIADALAGVDSADEALALLLERVVALTDADSGAVILRDGDAWTVAVARDRRGQPLADAQLLLSDTIVADVLAGGEAVAAADLARHSRYHHVTSVVALGLGSVFAAPMVLGGRVLGALYLGRVDPARPLGPRRAHDVEVIASMAIPFVAQLRRGRRAASPSELVGDAPAMVAAAAIVARVAPTDLAVLIVGPTGAGKEVAARALHAASGRRERPMIAVNCAAVPAGLLEAELFGHKKGAFTGATGDRVGKVEAAHGSTLFLDEIGDMPLAMQASLLRVLQEREVVRLGENQPRPVDVRVVTATHRDLDRAVAEGQFRADLLYRLREVTVALPPLAARGDDVITLARLFLQQAEAQLGLRAHALAPAAIAALRAHPWPGNVRELKAAMRRAAVLADGATIEAATLGLGAPPPPAPAVDDLGDLGRSLEAARDDFARRYVAAVIARHGGNREAAAAALGISLRSLYRYQG